MGRRFVALVLGASLLGAAACSAIAGIPDRELVAPDDAAPPAADAGPDVSSDAIADATLDARDGEGDAEADAVVDANDASPPLLADGATSLAAVQTAPGDVTVLFVASDGSLQRAAEHGGGPWTDHGAISASRFAAPGAPIATAVQAGAQTDAFLATEDGTVFVTWLVDGGAWAPPRAVTASQATARAAQLAPAARGNRLDLFYVDRDGHIADAWVLGTDGSWQGPAVLGDAGIAPPGAGIVAGSAVPGELDVLVVDDAGRLEAAHWSDDAGAWSGPAPITSAAWAPAGAPLASGKQTPTQLDVFAIDGTGAPSVVWTDGSGQWGGPAPLTPDGGIAPPGAPLAAVPQGNQLDLFTVDDQGALDVLFVIGLAAWSPAQPITQQRFAQPGASVALSPENGQTLDAFLAANGTVWITWEVNDGAWQVPVPIL